MQAWRAHARGAVRASQPAIDRCASKRHELGDFAIAALELGVRYLGICCGAGPHHVRAVAEAAGKTPPASRYSPDMSKHSFLGSAPGVTAGYREYAPNLSQAKCRGIRRETTST